MNKKAVIFDLDGTLLDTLDDLSDTVNEVLTAAGYPGHDTDFYRKAIGDGAPNLIRRSLPKDGRDPVTIERMLDHMREAYDRRWKNKTHPYEGITELLRHLQAKQVTMVVLSNKPHRKTLDCIQHFFPDSPFHGVYGARENVPLKPHPDAVLSVMQALAIESAHTLYVGDTNTDMQTATGAGLFAVGVTWGFRDAAELREHGAQAIIHHPMELVPFL